MCVFSAKKKSVAKSILLCMFSLSFLTSCALHQSVKDVDEHGFIEIKRDHAGIVSKRFPFQYAWIDPDFDTGERNFTSLVVAPITLEHLDTTSWRTSMSATIRSEEGYVKKAKEIAAYLQAELLKEIREQFAKDPNRDLEIVDFPQEDSMVFELALTEMVFGNPAFYGGATITPVPGVSHAYGAAKKPWMAFEARFRDAKSGEIFAAAADRKFPKIKIMDLNRFTVSSPLREVSQIWADEFARSLLATPGSDVSSSSKFSLLLW